MEFADLRFCRGFEGFGTMSGNSTNEKKKKKNGFKG
jgi:hypothetical protein